MTDILVGHDAEFFLFDPRKSIFIPSIGLFGGTKTKPRKLTYGAVQEDNVMVEINIPPAATKEQFVEHTTNLKEEVSGLVSAKNLQLKAESSALFTKEILKMYGNAAVEAGCMLDFNPYSLQAYKPVSLEGTARRYAGGHLHISWPTSNNHPMMQPVAAILCDVYIGLPFIMLNKHSHRLGVYGRPGAFRSTEYGDGTFGIEYRAIGPEWTNHKFTMECAFTAAHEIATLLTEIESPYESLIERLNGFYGRIEEVYMHFSGREGNKPISKKERAYVHSVAANLQSHLRKMHGFTALGNDLLNSVLDFSNKTAEA